MNNNEEINIEDLSKKINMDEYYSLSEAKEVLSVGSNETVKKLVKKYNFNIYRRSKYLKLVSKRDILFIKNELNKYFTYQEACDFLGVCEITFRAYMRKLNCKAYGFYGGRKYFLKKDIMLIMEKRDKFWDNHYDLQYVKEHIELDKCKDLRVEIPIYALLGSDIRQQYAYEKKVMDEFIESQKKLTEYTARKDATDRLNITWVAFVKTCEELGIEVVNYKQQQYVLTPIIDSLCEQQKEMFNKYITTSQAIKKYKDIYPNIRDILWRQLDGIEIPPFCWKLDYGKTIAQEKFYIDDEINDIISERLKLQQMRNTYGESAYDTFLKRLAFYDEEILVLNNSHYTLRKWQGFALMKLGNTDKTMKKTEEGKVNRFVNSTIKINDLLKENNVEEIYSINTSQLMIWLNGFDKRGKMEVFYFLREVSNDIAIRNKGVSKGFNIAVIEKAVREAQKVNSSLEEDSNAIYDYATYIKIFEHLINIKLHVKRAIELGRQESIAYLSTWLYAMLHLNNGWRHGDITRFPRLHISDILEEWEIDKLEWFKENTISEAQSRRIVSRIVQFDYSISKTDTYGHFFCSDKLAPGIATAITMLEYYCEDNVILTEEDTWVSIMDFGTKYNEPTAKQLKKLFNKINVPKFKFTSKKMNKTVLTLLYNTACAVAPSGYNLLLLPKHLRSHIEDLSTIQYIQFTEEQLEFLSGELFERGEFGFITDKLLNLISDKPEKSIDRTSDISNLNALFGDVRKVEAMVGMLNNFKNEKEEILNEIMSYLNNGLTVEESYSKCIEVVTNIFMQNLPSRQEDIQCLFSETGCKCIGYKCIDCKYQIPNIYILRTICLALKEEIYQYIRTPQLGKRIKLSAKIHTKINIFMEAIDRYGKDYVYNCIDMNRDDFVEMFNMIPEVEDLLMLQ